MASILRQDPGNVAEAGLELTPLPCQFLKCRVGAECYHPQIVDSSLYIPATVEQNLTLVLISSDADIR